MRTTVDQSRTQDEGASGATRHWCASLVHHEQLERIGTTVAFTPGGIVELGRECAAFGDGTLEDARLSREHAQLGWDGRGAPTVRDLGSRNQTFVNGKPIAQAALSDGDIIGLGPFLLLVHRSPPPASALPESELVGRSRQRESLLKEIRIRAQASGPVVITGETGAGKTAAAGALHRATERPGSLHILDCRLDMGPALQSHLFGHEKGAFPGADDDRTGVLEAADGGTLLLDSVADAPVSLQRALERFLESSEVQRVGSDTPRRVDARIVVTTTAPLDELVSDGALRAEFVSRLGTSRLFVPPLRERVLDVPLLAAHFVERYSGERRPIHRKLMLALLLHPWFGNVRELDTMMETVVLEADAEGPLRLTQAVANLLTQGRKTRVARKLDGTPAVEEDLPWAVMLARSGEWFECEGQSRVRLDRRPSLALILAGLVAQRQSQPGEPLAVRELLALGWPGEKVREPAGANRVYVALTSLRKLGLRDVIRRSKLGYWIDPEARVEIADK